MSPRDTASTPSGPSGPSGRRDVVLRVAMVLVVLLAANWLIADLLLPQPESRAEVPYRPTFLEEVRAGNVERISPEGEKVVGRFGQPVEVPDVATGDEGQGGDAEGGRTTERFSTTIPAFADEQELSTLLERGDVVITAEPEEEGGVGPLTMLLFSFGPVILLVLLFVFLMRRAAGAMGGGGPFGQLGRSKARRIEGQEQEVRFSDVAGIDEPKGELEEVVDFLRDPDRYRSLGARIPRGVLLTGPPGTGKTLLARAVAGEAGAPFFSLSGSEFVEMVVGVGASRVRDLFGEAKKESSAIVFIDELDAVGRRRSSSTGVSGGNDEREQTLNQILTEMDGFEQSDAVIVLAATNRPEDLDEALTRPGRFDRQVDIAVPDRDGRVAILGVHTKSLPLAEDVDLDRLAAMTPGMTGADLANLANEAALAAARRHRREVAFADFEEAFDRLALGRPRGITLSEEDRRLTAYHEAGHALVGMLTPRADPVRKITIMPRGQGLGVTLAAPDADRVSYGRAELAARMRVLLGGRVAEELACDDVTTGAENDLEQVTDVARRMAGRWGMSERLGPLSLLPRDGTSPLEAQQGGGGEDARRRVDDEAERMVCEMHAEVQGLLADHREQLDALAAALLEHETLEEDAIYSAVGLEGQPERGDAAPAPTSG